MRIALVSDHLTFPGDDRGVEAGEGRGSHVTGLAGALLARGHDVRVYARDTGRRPATPLPVEYVPAGPAAGLPDDEAVRFVGDLGRWLAARWAEPDARPDVIHSHFWLAGLAALTATAESRIPVVVTFHGLGAVDRDGPPSRPGLERSLGRLADLVVAQSVEEADQLGRLGVPRTAVVVVPGAVDVDRFTPDGPAVDRPADRLRVVGLGPADQGGQPDLIRALRGLPDAGLVLTGGPDLATLANRAGLADRVAVLDAVPGADLPAWYRSADLACYPTAHAPSVVPLEAMACGVPVVGYAAGGVAECVIDSVTGALVPPGDVRGLTRTLRGLLDDRVRRLSYSCAAADRVRALFTWDRVAEALELNYARLRRSARTRCTPAG